MDTIAEIPMPALTHLHMDPDHPVPGTGDGVMLSDLEPKTIEALLATAGPGWGRRSSRSRSASSEARSAAHAPSKARSGRSRPSTPCAVGVTPTPDAVAGVRRYIESVKQAVEPWTARHAYLNFCDTGRDPRTFWGEQAHHHLTRIKRAVDPDGVIRSNHPVSR